MNTSHRTPCDPGGEERLVGGDTLAPEVITGPIRESSDTRPQVLWGVALAP